MLCGLAQTWETKVMSPAVSGVRAHRRVLIIAVNLIDNLTARHSALFRLAREVALCQGRLCLEI